jgi:hypothetical protein
MPDPTQISALVSSETKELLDRLTRATGIKKARIIEDALRHHLRALAEFPADVIVPPRIVLGRRAGEWLLDRVESPPPPTDAMRELFDDA